MIHADVPLVNKNIYIWFFKPICFATPKLYFATTNGVANHRLRSPALVYNMGSFWTGMRTFQTLRQC